MFEGRRIEGNGHVRSARQEPAYREFSPPSALRAAVECLWVRKRAGDASVRVLPDGCVDVVWEAGRGAVVAGPDTTAKLIAAPAQGGARVGIRFLPGSGAAALRIDMGELRDQRVDAREVRRDLADRLVGELAIEDVVRELLASAVGSVAARPPDAAVREAAARLSDPRMNVEAVAAEVGLSERQLRRRFEATVGYGPKTLQRVLRFRRVLGAIDRGETDLGRVAADTGYADQAHLTREIGRLAGLTPAALVRDRAPRGYARQSPTPGAG
jgi:AraC-like DNA-binding protein